MYGRGEVEKKARCPSSSEELHQKYHYYGQKYKERLVSILVPTSIWSYYFRPER